jgi:hypothetical protein
MNKLSLISQLTQLRTSSAINLGDSLTYSVRLTSARGPVELSRSPRIEVTADEWQDFLRYKIDRIERQLLLRSLAAPAGMPIDEATSMTHDICRTPSVLSSKS